MSWARFLLEWCQPRPHSMLVPPAPVSRLESRVAGGVAPASRVLREGCGCSRWGANTARARIRPTWCVYNTPVLPLGPGTSLQDATSTKPIFPPQSLGGGMGHSAHQALSCQHREHHLGRLCLWTPPRDKQGVCELRWLLVAHWTRHGGGSSLLTRHGSVGTRMRSLQELALVPLCEDLNSGLPECRVGMCACPQLEAALSHS